MNHTTTTLRDIGRALGLAKSTVQRALSGHPSCSVRTREAVWAKAKELNYRPDPIFAAISARRRREAVHSVPLVLLEDFNQENGVAGLDYYPRLMARANELGYLIEHINLSSWSSSSELWKTLYFRGVAGIVLGRVRNRARPLIMRNDMFPIVCCGRIDNMPFATVKSSVVLSLRALWEKLLAMGYRRIGAALGRHEVEAEDDFMRLSAALGCLDAFHTRSEFVPPLQSLFSDTKAFSEWIFKHRPEVVISLHAGFYFELLRMGFRVPQDIGCAVLNLPFHDFQEGTGMVEDVDRIACTAVNMLDQMIRHGERGIPDSATTTLIEPIWRPGKTCRPIGKMARHGKTRVRI